MFISKFVQRGYAKNGYIPMYHHQSRMLPKFPIGIVGIPLMMVEFLDPPYIYVGILLVVALLTLLFAGDDCKDLYDYSVAMIMVASLEFFIGLVVLISAILATAMANEWFSLAIFVLFYGFIISKPQQVVAITGVSGSGKTTIGKRLAEKYGAKFIDLDSYFRPKSELSRVALSNGTSVTNYDDYSAINWEKFWVDLEAASLNHNLVVVVGFCLPRSEKFDQHFHLELSKSECKERRIKSKNLAGDKIELDSLEVDELVWPFYEENYPKAVMHIDAQQTPDVIFNIIDQEIQ